MFNALWAYSGSSQPIMDIILDGEKTPWGFNIFSPQFGDNCEDSGFCRFPKEGLAFEHTLYLDTTLLWEKATRRGVNLPERARGFAFSEEVPASDFTADEIYVDFWGQLNALWTYEETTGRYLNHTWMQEPVSNYGSITSSLFKSHIMNGLTCSNKKAGLPRLISRCGIRMMFSRRRTFSAMASNTMDCGTALTPIWALHYNSCNGVESLSD
jgi:hypothetical protein